MNEQDIQAAIRVAISEHGSRSFRINVGIAWTGNKIIKHSDGSLTIYDPRPFATFGSTDETKKLKGFSDLLIVVPKIITSNMIGKKLATIAFIEVKTKTGRPSPEQLGFIEQMQALGCKAGMARNPEQAIEILKGER